MKMIVVVAKVANPKPLPVRAQMVRPYPNQKPHPSSIKPSLLKLRPHWCG